MPRPEGRNEVAFAGAQLRYSADSLTLRADANVTVVSENGSIEIDGKLGIGFKSDGDVTVKGAKIGNN